MEKSENKRKLTILDTYKKHYVFYVVSVLLIIAAAIVFPNLLVLVKEPTSQILENAFLGIGAILFILAAVFLIINIIDTIKVIRIIGPTPLQLTMIFIMYLILTLFAGAYVNSLIKNWKKRIAETE